MRITAAVLERNAYLLIAIGGIAALALAICALFDPSTTARAVLFAWLYWLGISVGGMVLLAAHSLTGGRWGEAIRPILQPATRALLIAALPFAIVILSSRLIYPWSAEGASPAGGEVAQTYFDPLAFTIRGVVILGIWSLFGLATARHERLSAIWASIALALYLPTITVAAMDWSASLLPHWSSSAYGVLIGASQVTAALAFAALLRSGEPADPSTGDVAGLLLAGVLGMTYLGFMQFLVIWSSGMPDKTVWYELRLRPDAIVLIVGAFLAGSVLPFFQLIRTKVRMNAAQTGMAGLMVLVGLAFFWAWQIIPTKPPHALFIYVLAFVATGAAWLGIAFGPLANAQAPWLGASRRV